MGPKIIVFDADDTLWMNEPIFTETQARCKELLARFVEPEIMEKKLYETEKKNLRLFGYGIKGFMLSMIETAIELSGGEIKGTEVQRVIDLGKDMLQHPVQLLPNVKETIEQLEDGYELMIITKGDLFDQESKIARSGIADHFNMVEIVSEKDPDTYASVFKRYQINIKDILMVGNSLKSDIVPICQLGGRAVHIPYHTTWVHEIVSTQHTDGYEYEELSDISLVPEYLKEL